MRTWLAGLAALGCLAPAATAVQAQTYPAKPITIVVPAAPGGVTDALGRMLAQRFTEAWGQQAIVENKPGANNQIAAEYVTKARARRLHAVHRPGNDLRGQSEPLRQARLRPGEGLHADLRPRHHQPRTDRPSDAAGRRTPRT